MPGKPRVESTCCTPYRWLLRGRHALASHPDPRAPGAAADFRLFQNLECHAPGAGGVAR